MPSVKLETYLMPLLDRALRVALIYAGVMAWLGTFILTARAVAPGRELVLGGLGFVFVATTAALAWTLRRYVLASAGRAWEAATCINSRRWLVLTIVVGIVARVLWIIALPAQPSSDGATYLQLASALTQGLPYQAGGTRAYWPPGYPLFLAPWLLTLGDVRTAVAASNIALFVIGALGVHALARAVANERMATIATILFAVWPNLVFLAGVPEKELVLVALLPWVLHAGIASARASRRSRAIAMAVLAGVLLGAGNLVQPALILFPSILILAWVISSPSLWRAAALSLALVAGAASVILPWSFRNFQVLGQFVLVSTNGGVGLYGANNPRASGGYFEHWGDADLLRLPELEADREGKRRALEWVREHPADFAALAFEKNLRFMGDDAVGAFQTIKRGNAIESSAAYAVFKGLSNLWWLGFWSLIVILLVASWRTAPRWTPLQGLVPAAFVYSFALHSIAESAGKYHVLMTGILCVLPLLLINAIRSVETSQHGVRKEDESR